MCNVYVKLIQMGETLYSGYGMAEDAKQTEVDENRHLERAGFKVVSTENFKFPNRKEATAMETHIKNNTLHVDLKVDRFRTEAAPGQQHSYILRMVAERLAGNKGATQAPEEQPQAHYSDTLDAKKKAIYTSEIAKWEAILESAWNIAGVKGDSYRATVKQQLEENLQKLRGNDLDIDIQLPYYWNIRWTNGRSIHHDPYINIGCTIPVCKPPDNARKYNGQGFIDIPLNGLRQINREELLELLWSDDEDSWYRQTDKEALIASWKKQEIEDSQAEKAAEAAKNRLI